MNWIRKHLKWIAWGIVAAATTFLAILFKGFEVPKERRKPKLPNLPPELKKRVRKAEEEAVVARVLVKAKEAGQKKRLKTISGIRDDEERRRQLAELMKEL